MAAAAGLVVNATPVGMAGSADAAGAARRRSRCCTPARCVADLVYHPRETPLVRGARERGAAVVDGLGMLVHQAALQIERWSGRAAPVAAMRAAAERALRPDQPS